MRKHKIDLPEEIDFTTIEFKRAFLKCFDVYTEEVSFGVNQIVIHLSWITPASVVFSLMHKNLRQVTIVKSGKEIFITSKIYRIAKVFYVISYLMLGALGFLLSLLSGHIAPMIMFVGFPLSIFLPLYFFVKRSPLKRFTNLVKVLNENKNAQLV